MVSASSYAGEIQALFYGFDVCVCVGVKGLWEELIFGNVGARIPTYVRNDNSDAAYKI